MSKWNQPLWVRVALACVLCISLAAGVGWLLHRFTQ